MLEEQPVVPLTTSNLHTVTKLQAPHKSQYNMGELLRVSELQTIMEGSFICITNLYFVKLKIVCLFL